MRTNIVLNDALVAEAFKYSVNIHTKRELVEVALQEYIQNRKIKDIRELKGKISFDEPRVNTFIFLKIKSKGKLSIAYPEKYYNPRDEYKQ